MELTLVLDVGSTHLASIDNMMRHIDKARGLPCMLKCQLFEMKDMGPNTWLPLDVYQEAYEYAKSAGVRLFTSVFSERLAKEASAIDRRLVKLAYSKRHMIEDIRPLFDEFIVSYPMTEATIGEADNVKKLLCIPEYPVYYPINSEAIHWPSWYGFSDHTLGIDQTVYAVRCAEQQDLKEFMIEKHVRLERDTCPDSTFAIGWDEVKQLVRRTSCGSW